MNSLLEISELSEAEAREHLESIVWPNGVKCPHCGCNEKAYKMQGETQRDGLYKCANTECTKQFTFTVGTIMEGSHLSMKQWLMAFHMMALSKKGVSALQLQRQLGIGSYKTAWFLAHRIRVAMENKPASEIMKGTIEADETYVGGKPRKGNNNATVIKRGRGTKKTPVLVLVSREGEAYAKPVERVNGETLKGAIRELVDKDARIITDDWAAYKGIGEEFEGGHHVVNHSAGEYARGDVHTNNAESYFALLKRGVTDSFHHVSKKHLGKYCDEFSFRWTNRKIEDGERTAQVIKQIRGKKLVYKTSKHEEAQQESI